MADLHLFLVALDAENGLDENGDNWDSFVWASDEFQAAQLWEKNWERSGDAVRVYRPPTISGGSPGIVRWESLPMKIIESTGA